MVVIKGSTLLGIASVLHCSVFGHLSSPPCSLRSNNPTILKVNPASMLEKLRNMQLAHPRLSSNDPSSKPQELSSKVILSSRTPRRFPQAHMQEKQRNPTPCCAVLNRQMLETCVKMDCLDHGVSCAFEGKDRGRNHVNILFRLTVRQFLCES